VPRSTSSEVTCQHLSLSPQPFWQRAAPPWRSRRWYWFTLLGRGCRRRRWVGTGVFPPDLDADSDSPRDTLPALLDPVHLLHPSLALVGAGNTAHFPERCARELPPARFCRSKLIDVAEIHCSRMRAVDWNDGCTSAVNS
jgi:hypothetical protein